MADQDMVRVSLYMSADEKRRLQELAGRNMRSMASEARAIIVEKLNKKRG